MVLLVLAVAASRLLLVPATPLDPTELELATGALVAGGDPSPWVMLRCGVLLARLGLWLTGDPVLGLQLLVALASVLSVPLLVSLWRQTLPHPGLGAGAGLLYALAPGVWFFAWRFSSATLQILLILLGLSLWLAAGRASGLLGGLCLGAAALVSPTGPLLVLAVLLVLLVVRWQPLAGAVTVLVAAAGLLPMLGHGAGMNILLGPPSVVAPVPSHLDELGLLRALGGPLATAVVLLLVAVGLWSWARYNRRHCWLWSALLLAALISLIPATVRGSTGAALPVVVLLSGPCIAGLSALLRRPQLWVAAMVCLVAASATALVPAAFELVRLGSIPLAALAIAQAQAGDGQVLLGQRLEPYAELLAAAGRPLTGSRRGKGKRSRPWAMVTLERPAAWVPPPNGQPHLVELAHAEGLTRLDPLGRYRAMVISDGALLLPADQASVGEAPALLQAVPLVAMLQPAPPGSWLGVVVEVKGGSAQLELAGWFRAPRSLRVTAGRHVLHLPAAQRSEVAARTWPPTRVRLRQVSGAGRALLRRLWIDRSDGHGSPTRMTPAQQVDGLDGLVLGNGFYGRERVGKPRRAGRWSGAQAWLSVPAGPGSLVLTLVAPRPQPAEVLIRCRQLEWQHQLTVGSTWTELRLPVSGGTGRLRLELEVSNPFVPAASKPGSNDRRSLGVVLGELRYDVSDPAGR